MSDDRNMQMLRSPVWKQSKEEADMWIQTRRQCFHVWRELL